MKVNLVLLTLSQDTLVRVAAIVNARIQSRMHTVWTQRMHPHTGMHTVWMHMYAGTHKPAHVHIL